MQSEGDDAIDLECGLTAPPPSDRRQLERDLVLLYDSKELRRHEAWFLVETTWLDAWMSYVLGDPDDAMSPKRPGPLNNDSLFDHEEFRIKSGLKATKDYRGVNPQVYALYVQLYGDDGVKPIVRWTLDIYAVPVMIDDVHEMLHAPKLRARAAVSELNEQLEIQEKKVGRPREDKESWGYRCLCRCEFLVPCLNRLFGGGPTYKKEEKSWWESSCCCRRRSKKKKSSRRKKRDEEEETDSGDSSDEETHGLLG